MPCDSNRQKLCNCDKCDACYARSFVLHEKAEFLSDTNKLTQKDILKSTHTK